MQRILNDPLCLFDLRVLKSVETKNHMLRILIAHATSGYKMNPNIPIDLVDRRYPWLVVEFTIGDSNSNRIALMEGTH